MLQGQVNVSPALQDISLTLKEQHNANLVQLDNSPTMRVKVCVGHATKDITPWKELAAVMSVQEIAMMK